MDEKAVYQNLLYKLTNTVTNLRRCLESLEIAITASKDGITINDCNYKKSDLESLKNNLTDKYHILRTIYIPEINRIIKEL